MSGAGLGILRRPGVGLFLVISLASSAPVLGQKTIEPSDPAFRVLEIHHTLAGDEPALTRFDSRQFEAGGPGKAVERLHYAVTIFKLSGRKRGQFVISYDGMRKIKKLSGRIRDAGGRVVRELKKNDIRDHSAISDFSLYEDSRVRVAELYHDAFPYTVEYEVELTYDGVINWPAWYPQLWGEGLEFGALEIRAPIGTPVRYATRNLDIEPVQTDERGHQRVRWVVQMAPPVKSEEFGLPAAERTGSVHTAPAVFEIAGSRGDMSTWEGFGRWYAQLSRGADGLPPDALQDVLRLVEDAPDDREKVRRIFGYLQQRSRYVSVQLGIGGWKPYDAGYVHQRRYGDCKALTNYTIALLKAAGVPAYPALIRNGSDTPPILQDFPSNQFNHVVVFVPLAGDTLWLESTSQTIPFGHLGAGNEDRYALVVREDGSELLRTPASGSEQNLQLRRGRIELQDDGSAHADLVTSYSGNRQDRLRTALAHASGKQRKEWLHRTLDLAQFEVIRVEFAGVETREPTISIPLTLSLPRYASPAGGRLLFSPVLLDRWTTVPPQVAGRTSEIAYFSWPFQDVDTLDFVLPDGFAVEALAEPVQIEEGFGRFIASSELITQNTLRFTRLLEVRATRLPAEAYDAFRDFLSRVARSDKSQVVLVRRGK